MAQRPVPGISTRTIIDGNPDYLAWMERETAPDKDRTALSEDNSPMTPYHTQ